MLNTGAAFKAGWRAMRARPRPAWLTGTTLFMAVSAVNLVDFALQPLNPYDPGRLAAYFGFAIPWTLVVLLPVAAGADMMLLAQLRNKALPGFGAAYRLFGSAVGTYVLMGLIIALGFVLFIVPGIVLAGRLSLMPLFAVDQELTPLGALKASWTATSGQGWTMLKFVAASFGIALLGLLLLVVGLIPAIALIMLARAELYRMAIFEAERPDDLRPRGPVAAPMAA